MLIIKDKPWIECINVYLNCVQCGLRNSTLLFLFYHDFQIQDFNLHHIGSLDSAGCHAFSCVEESIDSSILNNLLPIVYRTNSGPTHKKSMSRGPLFTVAMEMKLDKERNSMVSALSNTHTHTHTTRREGMVWVETVATTKLLGYPHSPDQREFCTEGLLGMSYVHVYARENTALTLSHTHSHSFSHHCSIHA